VTILAAMPACSHHQSEKLLVAPPAEDPVSMKHIRVVLNVSDSGTKLVETSIAQMPARSYAVDPHGYRIVGRDHSGKSLGSLWIANPLFVRVFDQSGSAWQEHAVQLPSARVTVFVPFLAELTSLTAGYPRESQTRIDLRPLIRTYCGRRARRDEDCQSWLHANQR
jgi:hypothetical protein